MNQQENGISIDQEENDADISSINDQYGGISQNYNYFPTLYSSGKDIEKQYAEELTRYNGMQDMLFEATLLNPPTTEEEYSVQLQLKNEMVQTTESLFSEWLKGMMPYLVSNHQSGFAYEVDKIKACPFRCSSLNRLSVYSEKEPHSNKRVWSYSFGSFPFIPVKAEDIQSDIIRTIYQRITDFMEQSNYTMHRSDKGYGFWKSISIVTNSSEEAHMSLVVSVDEDDIIPPEEISELCEELVQSFCKSENRLPNLVSLTVDVIWKQKSKVEKRVIFGDGYLNEKLNNFNIKLFGKSRYFSNIHGLDLMMKEMMNLADLDASWSAVTYSSWLFLEPLYLSQICTKVYVICKKKNMSELLSSNTIRNNIYNVNYICKSNMVSDLNYVVKEELQTSGSICVFLFSFSRKPKSEEARILRNTENVKKIILFTQNKLLNARKAILQLCMENPEWNEPFVLVKSVSVDTSPFACYVKTMYLFLRKSLCTNIIRNVAYSQSKSYQFLTLKGVSVKRLQRERISEMRKKWKRKN